MDFELSDEQKQLQASVAKFAAEEIAPLAEKLDREGKFPTELFHRVGELGITAIPFEKKYGGLGQGIFEMVLALEQMARADQSLAITTMVSVGTGVVLSRYGTRDQAERYVPGIASGRELGAVAGTEPQAGSDTGGFKTRARREGDSWKIRGEKAFITNSGTDITSCILTMAVTSEPSDPKKSFTMFVVPARTPGLIAGEPYRKMGWRSSDTHPLFYEDCTVGADAVFGEAGKGRYILHKGYQQARGFIAACSLGLAQACLDHSIAYAKQRRAFGRPIESLQLIQKMIADMAVRVEAARLLTYRAAVNVDRGIVSIKDLAIAKVYATEIGTECADLAVQIHGGWGFMDDCPVSRYYRDNRVCTIGDGTSQIQSLLIARELGLDVRL